MKQINKNKNEGRKMNEKQRIVCINSLQNNEAKRVRAENKKIHSDIQR